MPVSWVEPHILVLSSRTCGNGAHLRLVLKQGDEQLLKYIFALQKQLQKDIYDAAIPENGVFAIKYIANYARRSGA